MNHVKQRTLGLARIALSAFLVASVVAEARAGHIRAWGQDSYGVVSNVPAGDDFIAVAAGGDWATALRADGSVVSWGYQNASASHAPNGNDFIAIDSGGVYSLALKSDGSIVTWGMNYSSIVTDTPAGKNFVAIAAGSGHAVALTADGTTVVWGDNYWGQHAASGATGIRAIDAGAVYTIAIANSGSLLVWDQYPESDPAEDMRWVPSGRMAVISAGGTYALAQREDGMIVGWGTNSSGQAESVDGSDFTAFSAGANHNLALRDDGSLFAWGGNGSGQCNVPSGNNFTAASAGAHFSLAIEVPEPSTWALLLTLLPVGLALWRRIRS